MFANLTRRVNDSHRKNKGFTLVELIVVLVILVILMAMLMPALTGYTRKAEDAKYIAEGRQILVASQSILSEAYADGETSGYLNCKNDAAPGTLARDIADLAEMKDGTHALVAYGFNSLGGTDACEVIRVAYYPAPNIVVSYYRYPANGGQDGWRVVRS